MCSSPVDGNVSPYGAHQSVLFREALQYLTEGVPAGQEGLFADLTFGAGGHSFGLLEQSPHFQVIAFDQDPDSVANGRKKIEESKVGDRLTLVHSNFSLFPSWAEQNHKQCEKGLNGILMDLGVSSHQFDQAERGFSFQVDAPLDMRMDYQNDQMPNAEDLVNSLDEEELALIFFRYGEEKFSRRVAKMIVETRQKEPIKTTGQLEKIIWSSYPPKLRHGKKHPATRCFQALRIAVNEELKVLEEALAQNYKLLAPGGRLVVISFHSLEDRIVKTEFKKLKALHEDQCRILTKRPMVPGDEEMSRNNRARSAKMRVLEKI